MDTPAHLIHCPPGEGKTYALLGDTYTILADGEQTGGAYTLIAAIVPPGSGPPLHLHKLEDESFYVLEGEITFTVENRTVTATAGTFLQMPRLTPHAFKNNTSSPVRMIILCAPPVFDGFVKEFGHPLPSPNSPAPPPTPADVERLLTIVPKYGLELLSP